MPKRVETGIVTSDKTAKTRRVEIPRLVRHPRYGKFVRRKTICYVHDENNESHLGDLVEIVESRPLSADGVGSAGTVGGGVGGANGGAAGGAAGSAARRVGFRENMDVKFLRPHELVVSIDTAPGVHGRQIQARDRRDDLRGLLGAQAEHPAREVDQIRGVLGVGERLAVVGGVALVVGVAGAHRLIRVHVAVLGEERRRGVDPDLLAVVHQQDVEGLERMRAGGVAATLGVDGR